VKSGQLADVAMLGLLAWQGLWHGLWHPPANSPAALMVLFFALPILPGCLLRLKHASRGRLLAAFAALLYFMHGVMILVVDPMQRGSASGQVLLALLLVLAASWPGLRARLGRKQPAAAE
jgi:uncharacterized membrane protein